uniref:Uncharacterized protein n=1 Tax=Glossina brevipalpis TaxID=37001 RepID=A0A1A9WS59_9MUSC
MHKSKISKTTSSTSTKDLLRRNANETFTPPTTSGGSKQTQRKKIQRKSRDTIRAHPKTLADT